jgi:hypothetical protein
MLKVIKLLITGILIITKERVLQNYKKKRPDTNSSFQNPQKKIINCDCCNIEGHIVECCYRKKNKDRKQSKDHHMVCIAIDGDNGFPLCKETTLLHRAGKEKLATSLCEKYNMTQDTLVFDSGATSHSKDGMVNLKPIKITINVGNAEDIYSESIGTFKGLVTQKDGSTYPIST